MTPTLNPIHRHHEQCHHVREQMSDYLDHELDERSLKAVERHVRWCPNCRRMLSNLGRTLGGLRALRERPTPVDEPRSKE